MRNRVKFMRYLSRKADETGIGTRSGVAIYYKSLSGLPTLTNEFEQILTGYPAFRATTEDAGEIRSDERHLFPLNFHIQLQLDEVE